MLQKIFPIIPLPNVELMTAAKLFLEKILTAQNIGLEIFYILIPLIFLIDVITLYLASPQIFRKSPVDGSETPKMKDEYNKAAIGLVSATLTILSLVITSDSVSNTSKILPLFSLAVVFALTSFIPGSYVPRYLIAIKIQGKLVFWSAITVYLIFIILLLEFSLLASIIMAVGAFIFLVNKFIDELKIREHYLSC